MTTKVSALGESFAADTEGEWIIRPNTSIEMPEQLEGYFPEPGLLFLEPVEAPDMPARCISYERAEEFAKRITFDGESFYYSHVSGRFIFGDFIEALFVEHNYRADLLTVATLSLDESNVDSLRNLLEGGYIKRLFLMVSYFHYRQKIGTLVPYMKKEFAGFDVEIVVCREHYKHALFTTDCGKHIGVRGTANMVSSDCYESVFVHNNRQLNEYDLDMFGRLAEVYRVTDPKKNSKGKKTIKHIGGLKIWRTVAQERERRQTLPNM